MGNPPRSSIPRLTELSLAIETSRLMLRPLTEADADAIFPIVSQREFPKYMSWTAHGSREDTLNYLRHTIAGFAQNTGVVWAILVDGRPVGSIGLEGIEWQRAALRLDRAELGYWIAPALWGKGYMTEAANAVVRCGFETIGLHKVTTRCFVDNHASRRVIEKVGFRFVGRAEEDVWRDGKWNTQLTYELTGPEWPDVHTTMRVNRPRLT